MEFLDKMLKKTRSYSGIKETWLSIKDEALKEAGKENPIEDVQEELIKEEKPMDA